MRTLGGVIGIAIAQAVFVQRLQSSLHAIVPTDVVRKILQVPAAIGQLPPRQATAVRAAYGEAFNNQMRIVTYISIAAFFASFFTWRRHPKSLEEAGRVDTERGDREETPGSAEEGEVTVTLGVKR